MTRWPAVDPLPPVAPAPWPWIGGGLALLRDPERALVDCRERLGDTFVVDAFGRRLLWLFSPEGVRQLWALPEGRASKGLADFDLLSHKVPAELFAGRRTFPHDLFGAQDTEDYLSNLRASVDLETRELAAGGRFEIFAFTRRLAHRMGLASWAGLEAAAPGHLAGLVRHFDQLDSSESFVHPSRGFWTVATGMRAERRALAGIEEILGRLVRARDREGSERDDLFDRIRARWSEVSGAERERGIARDIVVIHMGSQSNLFAAMAWTLIHLLAAPELLARVREGDDDLLERCANEAIRVAQRSVIARKVHRPVEIADEERSYRVLPGAYVATLLSVTNTRAAPGLDRFDPDHYRGRVFARRDELAARELVTTFGHGRHACPAQRFSISAMRIALRTLIEEYELEPLYRMPRPLRRQIGGVARADRPCRVRYRRMRRA